MNVRKLPIAIFFLLALLATLGGVVRAQTKVGYLDAAKLLKKMPESVDAESRMGQLVSSWNREASDMQSDLTRKTTEYERRKLIMTDPERSAAETEIANLKKKIEDFRQSKYGPSGELYTQQDQLMKQAYDRLQKAIEDVAHDESYDYVIDRSSKDIVLLYANARHDLTLAVAKKLNIDTDLLTQPLIANQPKPSGQPGQQPSTQPHGINGQTTPGGAPPGVNGQNPPVPVPSGGVPPGAPPGAQPVPVGH